jgi:(1->4)-alpha-D-glucan 1-alpha-D-glucosylmutase
VDPDNRRPVDYRHRAELLARLDRAAEKLAIDEVLAHMEDGRCKLLLTWRALQLRHAAPQLFSDGDYRRLRARGSCAHHLCAFTRRHARRVLVVIAPRLYRRLLGDPARLPLGSAVWNDTLIELPADADARAALHNVVDGTQLVPESHGDTLVIPVAQALAGFPVALLSGGEDTAVPSSA